MLYRSSVGKKAAMAVTGAVLYAFMLAHTLGNLKIYQGAATLDAYAAWLRTAGAPLFGRTELLWVARLILLTSVAIHIMAAIQLTRLSRAARPVGYARVQHLESTYASRTMRWGGVIIAIFVLFHLLDLTFGVANPDFIERSVYHNIVASFQVPVVSLVYIVGMVLVGLHMYHGLWSGMQTLGANRRVYHRAVRGVSAVFALGVALGNISIPIAVMAGFLR